MGSRHAAYQPRRALVLPEKDYECQTPEILHALDRSVRSDSGQQGGSGMSLQTTEESNQRITIQLSNRNNLDRPNWILGLDARQQLTDHRHHLNQTGLPSIKVLYTPTKQTGIHGASRSGLSFGPAADHHLDETSRLMGPAACLKRSLYISFPMELAMEHRTQASFSQGQHPTGTLDRCITSSLSFTRGHFGQEITED